MISLIITKGPVKRYGRRGLVSPMNEAACRIFTEILAKRNADFTYCFPYSILVHDIEKPGNR